MYVTHHIQVIGCIIKLFSFIPVKVRCTVHRTIKFFHLSQRIILKEMGKIRHKAKIRNPYNQIPHLTQDTIYESDKNKRKRNTNNKTDQKRSTALENSVRTFLKGLNMFDVTNLTLISDVDQDRQMFDSHERSLT